MKITKNRKGFLFTIGIIIFLIPLLFLLSYYTESSNTRRVDSVTKIRCDELHYLVEDIERDMERAVVIFGRRAALYATGWAVDNGPLANYTFNCSINCGLDCNEFSYNINGSEAAIAELVACGTLNSTNVTYMINHTLEEWIDRIELHGEETHFDVNITPINISVIPINAWEFAIIIWNNLRIIDESGTCSYKETPIMVMSNTSIVGIEDPLYPLNTLGRITKYIANCNITFDIDTVAGCSASGLGNGTVAGTALLYYSNIGNVNDLIDYCDDTPQETLGEQILVLDEAAGIACNGAVWMSCLNASHTKHFAGLISYFASATCSNCPSTIPYVCDTGELDDEIPYGGGDRPEGCDEVFITNGTCLYIRNIPESAIHEVTLGLNIGDLNTTCYRVSNSSPYSKNCSPQYPDGPSFFDRLDGNYNLSQKYRDQANSTFGNPWIGIETLVNPDNLEYYGLEVYDAASWIDYLYWNNSPGDKMCGVCQEGDYGFRLDCQHLLTHNLTVCT